jgi:ubiquinone/menaquinone biosynthesis C-methylase UbiE
VPKDFALESIRHLLLRSMERARNRATLGARDDWADLAASLEMARIDRVRLKASWSRPRAGELAVSPSDFVLYQRGDTPRSVSGGDPSGANSHAADRIALEIAGLAGIPAGQSATDARLLSEETFHDQWAAGASPGEVLVRESFEADTAPENRLVLHIFGEVAGKRILDLGCGLGEGAVYFASRGARVTACDLSAGMLEVVSRVAALHNVEVSLCQAPAENTGLADESFDLIYAANLLHHVDTSRTLDEIRRLLVPGGTFATWDPLAHNPVINIYRRLAQAVRTADEHPLRMEDLKLFRSRFRDVRWHCFWLTSQAVFLRFYLWERVHPGRERYWKKILTDAKRLAPFYRPLARLDRALLKICPWMGRYCWNLVVWGKK